MNMDLKGKFSWIKSKYHRVILHDAPKMHHDTLDHMGDFTHFYTIKNKPSLPYSAVYDLSVATGIIVLWVNKD